MQSVRLVSILSIRVDLAPLYDKETKMARKSIFVSDLSGKQIEEGKAAKIRISFDDARRGAYEIDATAEEALDLGRKGRQVARRGRRPKSSTS
jgi:hypothetical protein